MTKRLVILAIILLTSICIELEGARGRNRQNQGRGPTQPQSRNRAPMARTNARPEVPHYIYLPHSSRNTQFDPNLGQSVEVWPKIEAALKRLIRAVERNTFKTENFKHIFKTYSAESQKHQYKAIEKLLNDYPSYIQLLPEIAKLALRLPRLISDIAQLPLLTTGTFQRNIFTQAQVSSILANMFFGTFPKREEVFKNYPRADFFRLFEGGRSDRLETNIEKLKCFFNYFKRMGNLVLRTPGYTGNNIFYERRTLAGGDVPKWDQDMTPLSPARAHPMGETIETNGAGMLQVDFANKNIGGGTLGNGIAQEEIRFSINPELAITGLFTQTLGPKDVVVITGSEQFSSYQGYGKDFKFTGNFLDQTPIDGLDRRQTQILGIDALEFTKSEKLDQFQKLHVDRELNKAYSGFMYRSKNAHRTAIATGKWGAGVFNGHVIAKYLIQALAASKARRDLHIFPYSENESGKAFNEIYQKLVSNGKTVGEVYALFGEYNALVQRETAAGEKVKDFTHFLKKRVVQG